MMVQLYGISGRCQMPTGTCTGGYRGTRVPGTIVTGTRDLNVILINNIIINNVTCNSFGCLPVQVLQKAPDMQQGTYVDVRHVCTTCAHVTYVRRVHNLNLC